MSDTHDEPADGGDPVVTVGVAPRPSPEADAETGTKTRRQPPYHVILLNDEEHTFEYVIELIMKLFGHPRQMAEELTLRVHQAGRAVVFTTHRELAELKREQVLAYGPDIRMASSKGPIGCVIEPAPG